MAALVSLVQDSPHKYVAALFVDIRGAFDNVWWPAVLDRLNGLNLPLNLMQTLRSYLENRIIHLSTTNHTVSKTVTKGCPQGSVLGPTLWNICMDAFLASNPEAPYTKFAYADDVVIVVEAPTRRELEARFAAAAADIAEWTHKQKLEISGPKSAYMLLKGKLNRNPIVRLANNPIPRVTTHKYLGIFLDSNLRFDYHIQQTAGRAARMLQSLRHHVQLKWGTPPLAVRTIYEKAIIPILTYGIVIWGHRIHIARNIQFLRSLYGKASRIITGSYKSVSAEAAGVLAGIPPITHAARGSPSHDKHTPTREWYYW